MYAVWLYSKTFSGCNRKSRAKSPNCPSIWCVHTFYSLFLILFFLLDTSGFKVWSASTTDRTIWYAHLIRTWQTDNYFDSCAYLYALNWLKNLLFALGLIWPHVCVCACRQQAKEDAGAHGGAEPRGVEHSARARPHRAGRALFLCRLPLWYVCICIYAFMLPLTKHHLISAQRYPFLPLFTPFYPF